MFLKAAALENSRLGSLVIRVKPRGPTTLRSPTLLVPTTHHAPHLNCYWVCPTPPLRVSLLLLLLLLLGRRPLKKPTLAALDLPKCLYSLCCCLCCSCCCCFCCFVAALLLLLLFVLLLLCFWVLLLVLFLLLLPPLPLLLLLFVVAFGPPTVEPPSLPLLTFQNVKNNFTIDWTPLTSEKVSKVFCASQQALWSFVSRNIEKKKLLLFFFFGLPSHPFLVGPSSPSWLGRLPSLVGWWSPASPVS